MAAYFTIDAAGWFVGSTLARGPWSPEACHAGPPAGLIAYSTWQPNGIGLADALLFDAVGAVGRACQTLLVQPTTTSDEGA